MSQLFKKISKCLFIFGLSSSLYSNDSITSFFVQQIGGNGDNAARKAKQTLSQAHFFAGDTNITPCKTYKGCVGNINLAQDIAKAFNKISGQRWVVGMSNIAVGKFRSGWSFFNTQVRKSTIGDATKLVGAKVSEGAAPGVSELDGTLVAINLTKLKIPDSMSLQEIKSNFFPKRRNIRVANAERTFNFNPDQISIEKSFNFTSPENSRWLGKVFLDHAVMVFKDQTKVYAVLNVGSIIGAKFKNWNLPAVNLEQTLATILEWDEKFFNLYRDILHEEEKDSQTFLGSIQKVITKNILYKNYVGKSFLTLDLPKDELDEAKKFMTKILNALVKMMKEGGDESKKYINASSDYNADIAAKVDEIKDGKTFFKAPGQFISQVFGIDNPTSGFDLNGIPKESFKYLRPDSIYKRIAKYLRHMPRRRVALLSEALISNWAESKYGKFATAAIHEGKKDWNTWNKKDLFKAAPAGSFDLGIIYPKNDNVKILNEASDDPYLVVDHNGRIIINAHLSGDGPIAGEKEREKLLLPFKFCEDYQKNPTKVFSINVDKAYVGTNCSLCSDRLTSQSRGEGNFACVNK